MLSTKSHWTQTIRETDLTHTTGRRLNSPQQKRSLQTLERMLTATRALMEQHGTEAFTLIDVCKQGKVAIGSIYLRFSSKDNLMRAVLERSLKEIDEAEEAMLKDLKSTATDLDSFVGNYVERFAELLRANTKVLRLAMERASFDPYICELGRGQGNGSALMATEALQAFRGEQEMGRFRTKALTAYQLVFASMARELGLGSSERSAQSADWPGFKREISAAALAYLKYAP